MRIYIPDMPTFFDWAERSGMAYTVLRGFNAFQHGYPLPGAKGDVDMLFDDASLPVIQQRYSNYKRNQGTKCDIYGVTGTSPLGTYLTGPYFPLTLAQTVLKERRKWHGLFFVPDTRPHLNSLLYHIAYQKAEHSKVDILDQNKSTGSKYINEIHDLTKLLGLTIPLTLTAFHDYLKAQGQSVSYSSLVSILENDFKHDIKSLFRAKVCAEQKGEMNLFVIRSSALKGNAHKTLLKELNEQYQVLAVKNIRWSERFLRARKMRGGKWRRGGYPAIAVVVFDSSPLPTTVEDKLVHPFVFNARQFAKRQWREWYTQHTQSKPSTNPIHSTDNEAEAIGHLPFFFNEEERKNIYLLLKKARETCAH